MNIEGKTILRYNGFKLYFTDGTGARFGEGGGPEFYEITAQEMADEARFAELLKRFSREHGRAAELPESDRRAVGFGGFNVPLGVDWPTLQEDTAWLMAYAKKTFPDMYPAAV